MKIGYIIVREDLDSPIIQSQVVDVLKNIIKLSDHKIYLIWFCRIDLLWKSKNIANSIINDLNKSKIKVLCIPFLAGRFPVSWYLLPFVVIQWLLGLVCARLCFSLKLLHCRSYHAGLAGAVLNLISKMPYIFDPRSPFPEEHVAAGNWQSYSLNYRVWKCLETWIVQRSATTIGTSVPFCKILKSRLPSSKIITVPNNVSFSDQSNWNKSQADNEKLEKITLCYLGSLGHWNNEFTYVEFLQRLQKTQLDEFKALFVIPQKSIISLKKAIIDKGVDHKIIQIRSVFPKDVLHTIIHCTVGIQLMDHIDSRLSIKVVEYLAAGLPLLVSENVLGATEIVKSFNVGFVLRADWSNLIHAVDFIKQVNTNREYWRLHCRRIAGENFSTKLVSKSLLKIYNDCIL